MTAITFTLQGKPDQRLDLSGLTPNRLAGLSEAEIAAIPVGIAAGEAAGGRDVPASRPGGRSPCTSSAPTGLSTASAKA